MPLPYCKQWLSIAAQGQQYQRRRTTPRPASESARRQTTHRTAGCFCCFLQRIISHRHLVSRRSPGPPAVRRTKNSQPSRCILLFSAVFVNNSKNRKRRNYSGNSFSASLGEIAISVTISK